MCSQHGGKLIAVSLFFLGDFQVCYSLPGPGLQKFGLQVVRPSSGSADSPAQGGWKGNPSNSQLGQSSNLPGISHFPLGHFQIP